MKVIEMGSWKEVKFNFENKTGVKIRTRKHSDVYDLPQASR
jgi:hypothetical protein